MVIFVIMLFCIATCVLPFVCVVCKLISSIFVLFSN